MLRVIAGIHGGRKLEQPSLKITRPTTDRTKEAIFSMIQFKVEKSIFLDLFSGSGSIAIEAVSRGAIKAVAIESNTDAFKVLKGNMDKLKIKNIEALKIDAIQYLERAAGKVFDFIYIDPPFDLALYNQSLLLIESNNLLSDKGYIIIETSNPEKIKLPKGFVMVKTKNYGKSYALLISKNI